MPKQENTAINDLIGFASRRPIDDIDEPALFSSPPPAAHLRPVPFGANLSPIGGTIAPLPRRRAPMSTPSQVPMYSDYAEDAATTIDGPPRWSPPPPPPQQFAAPAIRPAYPAPHQPPAYYQAPYPDHLETMRVGAMPLHTGSTLGREIVTWIAKLWIPFAALGVIAMALAGYRLLGDDSAAAPDAAAAVEAPPIVMAAAPAEPTPPIVAAEPVAAEPVAAEPVAVVEPATTDVPTDSLWQPTKPQPTIAPPSETIESEPELEPAPTAAPTSQRAAKRAVKRAAKRAAKRTKREKQVAIVEKTRPEKTRPEKTIAIAAAKPMKIGSTTVATKDTGAGKLTIVSTPSTLIYVDGRNTGMMTPKTLSLPEGNHKITLLSPKDRIAKTISVEIAAGSSAKLTKDFTK